MRIDHDCAFEAYHAQFKVNEKGRQRCIRDKQRNVHAYVVCDGVHALRCALPPNVFRKRIETGWEEITYNPYHLNKFIVKSTGQPVTRAHTVFGQGGKIYAKWFR